LDSNIGREQNTNLRLGPGRKKAKDQKNQHFLKPAPVLLAFIFHNRDKVSYCCAKMGHFLTSQKTALGLTLEAISQF
jgi:hypothetical protein